MENEYCGRQMYRGIIYEVYWNPQTKRVTMQRTDDTAFVQKNNYTAESKEMALRVAKDAIMNYSRR